MLLILLIGLTVPDRYCNITFPHLLFIIIIHNSLRKQFPTELHIGRNALKFVWRLLIIEVDYCVFLLSFLLETCPFIQ